MTTKTLCSNCGKVLFLRKGSGTSHPAYDVCPKCQESFRSKLKGEELEKFQQAVEFPVLLVDRDLRVLASNESCLKKLCGGASPPTGLLGGEFLGCLNSQMPERCGGTPACLECAIRKAAQTTLKTGRPQKHVPAHLERYEEGRKVRMELLVSTECLGDLVQITVETFFLVLQPPSN